jgi:hypothetical protein
MKRTVVIRDAETNRSPRGEWTRAGLTLICALIADAVQWLFPVLWPVCDAAMVIMFLILWRRRWEMLMALVPELIPGLALAPTWTLFAVYLILPRKAKVAAPARRPKFHQPVGKPVDPL